MNEENIIFFPVKTRHSITGVGLTMLKLYEIKLKLDKAMVPDEGRTLNIDSENLRSVRDEFQSNLFNRPGKPTHMLGMKIIARNKLPYCTYSVDYDE